VILFSTAVSGFFAGQMPFQLTKHQREKGLKDVKDLNEKLTQI